MHVIAADNDVLHGLLCEEVSFADATHRTNNRQMALYLLLVEDGHSKSEITGVWLLREKTSEMIKSQPSARTIWIVDGYNASWPTKTLWKERHSRLHFPLQLCTSASSTHSAHFRGHDTEDVHYDSQC